ncbi:glycoside hydrolase family 5 protein [Desulfosarcina ovata]|uniref:Exo-1,3-beta-glucanase D n=1 Tax=Desulfosarcina ovata subsp. ovata TaxID=2752305 RepID=A0A5K8ACK3_9BACT|nr:glycoside hydrolase family 5 protein [Desulfosarcina ovata]BBO90229.1 beta-glucosidase [Desulfosarcina ovata subsp. ovata]
MPNQGTVPPRACLRGVNLGGWLLLEKWMTPSLFQGLAAADETTWCAELGGDAPARLRAHWTHFITREDFAWLKEVGINAVRIPLGHWIFGPPYPYHAAYGTAPHPFVEGGIDILDRALDWAEAHGLRVILDLHAAPGCQNGFDNGGIRDVCEWHTREEYLDHSVAVLGRIAERYRSASALYGIELLNEPQTLIPTDLLKRYYLRAYDAIRKHCPPQKVAIVFHDGFRSHREYLGFMQPPDYENVLFDVHRYQCFEESEIEMDIHGHLNLAGNLRRKDAGTIQQELGLPTIVGEWSLGFDPEFVSLWPGPFDHALRNMDTFQTEIAYRAYASAQLLAFEHYHGWFFWSYRTERTPEWCFRECVARGWLPSRFQ